MNVRITAVFVAALAALWLAGAPAASSRGGEIPSFTLFETGPDGGTVWQGVIPSNAHPNDRRRSLVYLPPGFSTQRQYPTVYLLHGFPGSPYHFLAGLRFAEYADRAVTAAEVKPFIAVMPVAGLTDRYDGEWAGRWEDFVVNDVVPWADATLPTIPSGDSRAIAGFSAGGYGAVDIGLRHPGLFGTLEGWSGYFSAPHDGPLQYASRSDLAAHNPMRLVVRQAAQLRSLGTRMFLSCGTRDPVNLREARRFARLLTQLQIVNRTEFLPGAHSNWLWQAQLTPALEYAFPAISSPHALARAPLRRNRTETTY